MAKQRTHLLTSAACVAVAAALGWIGIAVLSSRSDIARAAGAGPLGQQISAGQSRVSSLAGAVRAASNQLGQLRASITTLESRISRIQVDLNAKRAQLIWLRTQVTGARARLAQLEASEARGESVLSKQLVNTYEADRPDIVTVVIESTGFQDLLERIAFDQRIRKQDVQVVGQVRSARKAVAVQATRLGALEVRQQALTEQVFQQRNQLYGTRVTVLRQEIAVASDRSAKASQLASARRDVNALQGQLSRLATGQAAPAPQSGSTGSSGGSTHPPAGSGQVSTSGGFTFPIPKGSVSPPATWTLDQGVDMSAPGGTPEVAVCSGTVVLHGIGGFGPWAPVLHCDSPLSGGSYVYYGHAGPAHQLPVGTHVSAGQVISEVGPGIVGISSGPHLEIGFSDASGAPIGGGTASQMMALLQAAYAA